MIKLTMIVDSPHGFTAIVEDGDKQLDRREYADGVNCSYDKVKANVDKPYVSDALQAVIHRYEVQDTEVQVWNKTEAANNFEKMFCRSNLTLYSWYPENILPSLKDEGLKEEREKLFGMSDKELCEAVSAHFGSHPVQSGQKEWKAWAADALKTEGETLLSDYQRDIMVRQFGYARIQETRIKMTNPVYDPVPFESKVASLEREVFARKIAENDVTDVYKVDGTLQKARDGSVSVMGQCSDGNTVCLGKLHDNFLHNNPMNVDSCGAKIEIADFSNQKMKNLRMRVVVNSDEMSGDIVELNNDMLDGLEQDNGLNR